MKHLCKSFIVISSLLLSLNSFAEVEKRKLYIVPTWRTQNLAPRILDRLKENKEIDAIFEISIVDFKHLIDHPLRDKDQVLVVQGERWVMAGLSEYLNEKNSAQVTWYNAQGLGCKKLQSGSDKSGHSEDREFIALFTKYPQLKCFELIVGEQGYAHYLLQEIRHESPQVVTNTDAKNSAEPEKSEPWSEQLIHGAAKWNEKTRKDFIEHFLHGTSPDHQNQLLDLLMDLARLKHNSLKSLSDFLKSEREDKSCPVEQQK